MRAAVWFVLAVVFSLSSGREAAAQSGVITPGDNLVAENLPPIPTALAEEVDRYTNARSASFVDWHPVRREMLVATRFGDATQIHLVRAPGGARSQLTFSREPTNAATYQPTTGDYLVFSRDSGGDEFHQFYRYDVADARVSLLTGGGRSQNGSWLWSTRGDRLAYRSTRRNGADRDLWVMNPADPRSDRLVVELSGGGWAPLDWSPDDSRVLLLEFLSANRSNLWVVTVATGEKTAITPLGEDVSYDSGRFTADGRGVYVTSDRGSEFLQLGHIDLGTKAYTPLSPDVRWDVEAIDLSPDGRTLAFVTNEAGLSRLHLFDTGSRQRRSIERVPSGVLGNLRWRRNGQELGFTLTAQGAPAEAYSLVVASEEVARWTQSELGGLSADQLSEPELIRWRSFDGREITGFYYHPPARFTGRRPVLINIHGGPESQSRPIFLGRSNYFMQELGVAIIFPNVRGSTGFGKTFLRLDDAMKREDSVKDVGALLDWIAAEPRLDASRVMVTGGSYGGYMALAVASHYADRIRCAVDVVGISNFNTFLKNTESYRRDLRRAEYGDERDPEMAAFFERTAPLNNTARITKPLFVVQGGNDPRVPRTESEQMVARLKANGTPVWYLMAKDEGHGFAKKSNVDFQFYATVMFMQRYLLD